MSTERPDPKGPVSTLEPEAQWQDVGALEEFPTGGMRTIKTGAHQLVVARTETGEVYALDNRCPHEGYPLAQGTLKDCALTCCWHNWKFDVRDGSCTLGEEGVRAFPVRLQGGRVEVDLADPDPTESFPGLLESLEEGLFKNEMGRVSRDGVRLLQGGYDPWHLLARIARYDALHAEYGSTHALAVAADCGRVLDRYPGYEAMYAIAPAADMCADGVQRLPVRPQPAPIAGGDAAGVRAAVEAEEAERAEGLLLGAIEAGVGRAEIERWLYGAMSDHFLDFGHQLIYLVKAQELFDRAGDDQAGVVYPALLFRTVVGTREDTLPYMQPYSEYLRGVESELPDVYARAREDAAFDPVPLRDAVLDGRSREALDELWSALTSGVPAAKVARALVGAAAHRLYRYDPRLERDSSVAENFLWATHRFTFASAVRNAVERFDEPDALRFLFQTVAFTHSGRGMDLPAAERTPLAEEASSPEGVFEAVTAKDPAAAVARTLGALRGGHGAELRVALEDFCLRDPVVRPIAVAHVIKTTFAAFEEAGALGDGHVDRDMPLLAAVRTWSLPLVERRIHSAVGTSIRWVVGGEVPRKLTQ